MSYVKGNLIAGEKVIYQTRLHWLVMFWQVFLGGVLLGLPGVFLLYSGLTRTNIEDGALRAMQGGGAFLLFCSLAAILAGMLQRSATEIAVTNRRVVIKTGLINRKTVEMLLNKIESIEVNESLVGRMMGYGTIVVIGTGGTLEPFRRVAHPLEFRSQVQQQIENISS